MIPLSPIDLFFASPTARPSNLVLRFDGPLDHDLLASSLHALARLYTPLTMELAVIDRSTLALVDGDHPVQLERVELEVLPDEEVDWLPHFRPVRTVPGEPLVRFVQVCGPNEDALIVSFSHVLGDAAASFDLLMAWVDLARGRTPPTPCLDRGVFAKIFADDAVAMGSLVDAGLRSANPGPSIELADIVGVERTVYTREWLRNAREEAGVPVTAFALVAAQVWRALADTSDGEVSIAAPVDLRRLLPELPVVYFGNALRPAVARASADVVRTRTLGANAVAIQQAIRGVDRASLARDHQLVQAVLAAGGLAAMRDQRVTGADTVLVSDITFAPVGLIRFGTVRCTSLVPVSLYGRSVAIMSHPDGVQTVRARLR